MNTVEHRMVDTLKDLRDHHAVIGVKAEFEAEGTRLEEMLRLKEVCAKADLELTIKIGGCEALRDMYECRVIGVNRVVAPMVESAYALKKFLGAARVAFPEDEQKDIALAVNIETMTACEAFDRMLELDDIAMLNDVVMGRVDLTGSLGLSRDDINSDTVLEITRTLLLKSKRRGLKTVVGGGVSADSLAFFRALSPGLIDRYETRKVIFQCPDALALDPAAGILKAVAFELMWLKNKRDYYAAISAEDAQRIVALESRYLTAIATVGDQYA